MGSAGAGGGRGGGQRREREPKKREDASALKAPMKRGLRGQEWRRAENTHQQGWAKRAIYKLPGREMVSGGGRGLTGEKEKIRASFHLSPKVESENASPEQGVKQGLVMV